MMRRALSLILACCVAIALGDYAQAQSKKKGKEPELAISKRGKLIFEDDFSGDAIEWSFDPKSAEWKIVKGALTTTSVGTGTKMDTFRPFLPVNGIIVELRIAVPTKSSSVVGYGSPASLPVARIDARDGMAKFCLSTWPQNTWQDIAVLSLPYRKTRWFYVVFEVTDSRYALTVDGKTIKCDFPPSAEREINRCVIRPGTYAADVFAIDDVKVWEALPKDEEENKDDKGKKKK